MITLLKYKQISDEKRGAKASEAPGTDTDSDEETGARTAAAAAMASGAFIIDTGASSSITGDAVAPTNTSELEELAPPKPPHIPACCR